MKENRAAEETELITWHRKWTYKSVKALQGRSAKKISVHKKCTTTNTRFPAYTKILQRCSSWLVAWIMETFKMDNDRLTTLSSLLQGYLANKWMWNIIWSNCFVRRSWSDLKNINLTQQVGCWVSFTNNEWIICIYTQKFLQKIYV